MSNLCRIVVTTIATVWISNVGLSQEATLALRVGADFQTGKMVIASVSSDGPGTRLFNDQVPIASLEAGDVIESVDGIGIATHEDFVKAMNQSLEGLVRLKVRNVQDGMPADWWTYAEPTATDPYAVAKNIYWRGLQSNKIESPELVLTLSDDMITHNCVAVVGTYSAAPESSEVVMKNLMLGLLVIENNHQAVNVIGVDALSRCNAIAKACFDRHLAPIDEAQKQTECNSAVKQIQSTLGDSISDFAQRTNRRESRPYGGTSKVVFRVRCTVPGATVQLLSAADKVIILSRAQQHLGALTQEGLRLLDQSQLWKPLPQERASAYGRYYYRFVNGNSKGSQNHFDPKRMITITPDVVTNGEVVFDD